MCAVLQLRQAYEYDAKDRAAVVTDTRDGSTIRNIYDLTDRPTESEQRDGDGNLKYRTLISYDIKKRVKSFTEATATETKKTEYSYDGEDRATEVKYNGSDSSKVSYTYDKLNRITTQTDTMTLNTYEETHRDARVSCIPVRKVNSCVSRSIVSFTCL